MLSGATNTANDITGGKVTPGTALFDNISKFFTLVDAPRIFFNSFFVALVGTAITLIITSMAGYGFEMFRSKARDRIFGVLLLMLSVPFAAMMIPLFVMFSKAGLMNSYAAIMLPTLASICMIFYFRQNTKAFPHELRDAARMDGLKEWQIFSQDLHPGHAVNLCGRNDHRLHDQLERLSVAVDRAANQRDEDHHAGRGLARLGLHARLWADYDCQCSGDFAHDLGVFLASAPPCRRHAGQRQIGTEYAADDFV